jgi:hypothetical protein
MIQESLSEGVKCNFLILYRNASYLAVATKKTTVNSSVFFLFFIPEVLCSNGAVWQIFNDNSNLVNVDLISVLKHRFKFFTCRLIADGTHRNCDILQMVPYGVS